MWHQIDFRTYIRLQYPLTFKSHTQLSNGDCSLIRLSNEHKSSAFAQKVTFINQKLKT